ncbi:MAG: internal scaffolding protein [Microvirus sp.]|nr:MAG: internal scaffolding protein [Microvirus sp.]
MKPPFLRTEFNYDTNEASQNTALICKDKSLAKQSFRDECDINKIVERFKVTGELPPVIRQPTYGDFVNIVDFQTAMNAMLSAQQSFMQLDAKTRARFNNDPAAFVDFCSDDANRDEIRVMGLLSPEAYQTWQDEQTKNEATRAANEADAAAYRASKAQGDTPKGVT